VEGRGGGGSPARGLTVAVEVDVHHGWCSSRPRLRLLFSLLFRRRRRFCGGIAGSGVRSRKPAYICDPKTLVGRAGHITLQAPWAGPYWQRTGLKDSESTAQMVPTLSFGNLEATRGRRAFRSRKKNVQLVFERALEQNANFNRKHSTKITTSCVL
jgi:hypothetical protein